MENACTAGLTVTDRSVIDRARVLAGLRGAAIREHTRERDLGLAMASAFGEAQHLLSELVAIIERLESRLQTGPGRPTSRRLQQQPRRATAARPPNGTPRGLPSPRGVRLSRADQSP